MTSRELRTRRRAEERKARKQERKQLAPAQPKEEAQSKEETDSLPEIGFVSQNPADAARRAEINRQNAQRSTGPRTFPGKLASSRNATKHGLAGGQIIIPGEDPAAFDALLAALVEEHQPANATEELLITEVAQSHWLSQRAIRLQNDCFTADGIDTKHLALFLRYQTTHQRAFHKALNTLIALQKRKGHGCAQLNKEGTHELFGQRARPVPVLRVPQETRRKEGIGFVSQRRSSVASKNGFVSQNQPPEPDDGGFVSQNPPETRLPEVRTTPQAA
jgi:hypothetical protein